MKALDTGLLLGLLEGSTKVRDLLRRLRGTELATTEVNLVELSYLAAAGPSRSRRARLEAIERIRQRLTVLPLDARSTREASKRAQGSGPRLAPATLGMLAALEAGGCEELLTDDDRLGGGWSFRIRVLAV